MSTIEEKLHQLEKIKNDIRDAINEAFCDGTILCDEVCFDKYSEYIRTFLNKCDCDSGYPVFVKDDDDCAGCSTKAPDGEGYYPKESWHTIKAYPDCCHEFDSWYLNDVEITGSTCSYTFQITASTSGTYTAHYKEKEFTLSVWYDGSNMSLAVKVDGEDASVTTKVDPDTGSKIVEFGNVKCGSEITLTATPVTGRKVEGWYNKETGEVLDIESEYTYTFDKDMLKANCEPSYAVECKTKELGYTIECDGLDDCDVEHDIDPNTGKVRITAYCDCCNEVDKWYKLVSGGDYIKLTNDGTYTIGEHASGISRNYHFLEFTLTTETDGAYVVEYTPKQYTLSTSIDPSISGKSVSYVIYEGGDEEKQKPSEVNQFSCGDKLVLTAPNLTEYGYNFSCWKINNEQYTEYTNTKLTYVMDGDTCGDKTFTAYYTAIPKPTYIITVEDKCPCTTDPTDPSNILCCVSSPASGGGTFEEGSSTTIEAHPKCCYEFIGWYDANDRQITTTNRITIDNINAATNSIYVAHYREKEFSNSDIGEGPIYDNNGNRIGEVVVDNQSETHKCGDRVEIHCNPATGYAFIEWSDGNTNITRDYYVTLDSDCNLVKVLPEIRLAVSNSYTIQCEYDDDDTNTPSM